MLIESYYYLCSLLLFYTSGKILCMRVCFDSDFEKDHYNLVSLMKLFKGDHKLHFSV